MTENNKAQNHFQNAMAEFVGQNYENSIEELTRAIELAPDYKLAYLSRGSAFLKLNRLDEARKDFDRLLELDSKHARAYHLRGLVHEKVGDNEAALKDFNTAVELDPEYGAAYYSRATLHSKMGNADLATEDIEMVTHLTNVNLESFANENNIWRSNQMRLEEMGAADPMDR
jgi:tetratricopeptide (TPR) repeat protein